FKILLIPKSLYIMKQLVLLLIAAAFLVGCSDKVEFNTHALQATKNYKLWRARYFDATISENGKFVINAGDNIVKLTITMPSLKIGTYELSDKSAAVVTFVDADNRSYSTSNAPGETSPSYPEIGNINITEIDGNNISGDFRFFVFAKDQDSVIGFN